MILPTIRASFDRSQAIHLVELLGRHDEALREAARQRLDEEGVDSLLDDPRVLNALLTDPEVNAPPSLIFYVLVRQALLEGGVDDRGTADFVASLVVGFGQAGRAYRISDGDEEEFHYLVDVVTRIGESDRERVFLLRSHLGNHALWLTGLFPDFLEARTRRRGAPPLDYYEDMGRAGYRLAADSPPAGALGVDGPYREIAGRFHDVRVALNRVSDRYLWRESGDSVGRLLREVSGRMDSP